MARARKMDTTAVGLLELTSVLITAQEGGYVACTPETGTTRMGEPAKSGAAPLPSTTRSTSARRLVC